MPSAPAPAAAAPDSPPAPSMLGSDDMDMDFEPPGSVLSPGAAPGAASAAPPAPPLAAAGSPAPAQSAPAQSGGKGDWQGDSADYGALLQGHRGCLVLC